MQSTTIEVMNEKVTDDNEAARGRMELTRRRLQELSRNKLHNQGWIAANHRFHDVTTAIRRYAKDRSKVSEAEEAAFIDGATLALNELARTADIATVKELFARTSAAKKTAQTSLHKAS